MGVAGLDRESIRDISGNLVPLGILLFFMAWFVFRAPWGWDRLSLVIVYGLFGMLVVALFAVTYLTALKFEEADVEGDGVDWADGDEDDVEMDGGEGDDVEREEA